MISVPVIFRGGGVTILGARRTPAAARRAGRLARRMLDYACALAAPGVTTDAIDALVHDRIVAAGASQRLD